MQSTPSGVLARGPVGEIAGEFRSRRQPFVNGFLVSGITALEHVDIRPPGALGSWGKGQASVVGATRDQEDIAVRPGKNPGQPFRFFKARTRRQLGDGFPLNLRRGVDHVRLHGRFRGLGSAGKGRRPTGRTSGAEITWSGKSCEPDHFPHGAAVATRISKPSRASRRPVFPFSMR